MDGLLRIFVEQYLEVTKLIRIFAHKYRRCVVNGASRDGSLSAGWRCDIEGKTITALAVIRRV